MTRNLRALVVLLLFSPWLGSYLAAEDVSSLEPAAKDLVRQIDGIQELALAVVDFTDLRGDVLELGRFLAEELSVVLVRDGSAHRVITRTRLNALLQEHKLTPTGLINPEDAKKLGRISGVDVLVTGTITPLDETVKIFLQALDTETGDVMAAATASIQRTPGIDRLLQREVQSGVDSGSRSGVGDYQGKLASQQIEYMAVDLVALEVISVKEIRVTLRVRNMNRDGKGLGLAWSAVGSGGIADYWKFFPRVEAVVTDDKANKFEYASSSGPGFARTREDWLILEAGAEATISVALRKSDQSAPGTVFSFSAPVRLAWYPSGSTAVATNTYTIFLKDIRPKT